MEESKKEENKEEISKRQFDTSDSVSFSSTEKSMMHYVGRNHVDEYHINFTKTSGFSFQTDSTSLRTMFIKLLFV